jgi:hypothetical protein
MVIDKVSSGYSANPSYQVLKSFKKIGSTKLYMGLSRSFHNQEKVSHISDEYLGL